MGIVPFPVVQRLLRTFKQKPQLEWFTRQKRGGKLGLPNKAIIENVRNRTFYRLMKKLALITLLAIGTLSAQASGYHGYSHGYSHGGYGGWHHGSSISFSFGIGAPYYAAPYAYGGYGYYPRYRYYPGYAYRYAPVYSYPAPVYSYGAPAYSYSPGYSYGYAPTYATRPNYAVGGTLLGALAGGLIGNSVHHQGWEGAGIGALSGLFLGSIAEHNARVREGAYSYPAAPPVSYSQPSYSQPNYVPDAPTVNNAPTVAPAPRVPDQGVNGMGINGMFGR
jgi:hypothetical protein